MDLLLVNSITTDEYNKKFTSQRMYNKIWKSLCVWTTYLINCFQLKKWHFYLSNTMGNNCRQCTSLLPGRTENPQLRPIFTVTDKFIKYWLCKPYIAYLHTYPLNTIIYDTIPIWIVIIGKLRLCQRWLSACYHRSFGRRAIRFSELTTMT